MENSEGDGNTRPPDLPLEKPICRSESKLELDMDQQTGSKYEKEYIKAVYCNPAYLTEHVEKYGEISIMQNARWDEAQAGIKIAGEILITSDDYQITHMTPCLWQKVKN